MIKFWRFLETNNTIKSLAIAWLILISLSPASTKIAGLAFLLTPILGALLFKRTQFIIGDAFSLNNPAFVWFLFCTFSSLIAIALALYWADPLGKKHFDFRMLIGAVASLLAYKQYQKCDLVKKNLPVALLIASIFFITIIYLHIRIGFETPSNRINWTLGATFLFSICLGLIFGKTINKTQKIYLFLAIFIFNAGILFSQVRGAYFFPILTSLTFVFYIFKTSGKTLTTRNTSTIIVAFFITIAALTSSISPLKLPASPFERIKTAYLEFVNVIDSNGGPDKFNSSIGARWALWNHGLKIFTDNPIAGVGYSERLASIKKLGEDLNSSTVKRLKHYHNDYINWAVQNGVLGLSAFLSYSIGMCFLLVYFKNRCTPSFISILLILLSHSIGSLTNANTIHNNYGTMLSLCIFIVLAFISQRDSTERKQ
jgi:O-antigen ligase